MTIPSRKRIVQVAVITCGVVAFAAIIYPIFATARMGSPKNCGTHLKSVVLANIMYTGDNNDSLSPFYTFDGPESAQMYVTSLHSYLKNDDFYRCPDDKSSPQLNQEGIPGKISYVHCLSIRGVIPEFSTGKRILNLNLVDKPSEIPFMRDPIRGYGKDDSDAKTSAPNFLSPHGTRFIIGYLDGHTRSRAPINEFKEL
jgi:prepilin-type processing-associated H-X9-DG protein